MSAKLTDLPQEVINLIASFVERYEDQPDDTSYTGTKVAMKLPHYATISRSWQYAVECITFRELTLNSSVLPWFSGIMVEQRRAMLRYLTFEVLLPTYSDKACAKFENDKDKQLNNIVFSEAIKDLLGLLRSWYDNRRKETHKNDSWDDTPLELCLGKCYSPMDGRHRGKTKFDQDLKDQRLGKRHDLFYARYESSLLQLQSFEDIEEVPQVSRFDIGMGERRRIEPRSMALIAGRFPNLESIDWEVCDNEKRDPNLRQQIRFDFAQTLPQIPQNLLRMIHLNLCNVAPGNQCRNAYSALLPSFPTVDHLSLALHALSQSANLTHFTIRGPFVLSKSLFWPEVQSRRPFWPNLLRVNIEFSMNTADGDWYFVRDDNTDVQENEQEGDDDDYTEYGESSSDTDGSYDSDVPDTYDKRREEYVTGSLPYRCFRSKADLAKVHPLFEAAAKAASQMPRLEDMYLDTLVGAAEEDFTFGMTYNAPGQESEHDDGSTDIELPRLDWAVGPSRYIPEESTVEIWRRAKGVSGEFLSRIVDIQ